MSYFWDFARALMFGMAYGLLLVCVFLFARYVVGPYILEPIFKLFFGDEK